VVSLYQTASRKFKSSTKPDLRQDDSTMSDGGSITPKGIAGAYPQIQGFYDFIEAHTIRLHPVQQRLIEKTATIRRNIMLGDKVQMQFLQNLVRLMNAKKTLDIGVYTGYSALTVALALPDDGRVVALDISEEFTSVGKPFWKEAGVDHKIDLRIRPAAESLQKLVDDGESGTFDYAFVDANKDDYDAYYEFCLKLMRPGGLVVFDNTLRSGKVLDNNTTDPLVMATRDLLKKLRDDDRVDVSMLLQGDGTTLVFKK
jgi:predicted O-methyltransferase YrrM